MLWLVVENWQKTYFICSEEKNMLISKHIAGPHANGMAAFFLIFFTWGQKKKTSLIITWSKWGKKLGFQAYQGPVPCRPYKPPAAICPSFHLITATWGKKTIKTARKFIKGWLILFLLTDWVHIFHAWACISSEREEKALSLRLFPAWPLFVNRQSLWHTNLASKGFTLHRPQGLEAFQAYKTHLGSTKASGY